MPSLSIIPYGGTCLVAMGGSVWQPPRTPGFRHKVRSSLYVRPRAIGNVKTYVRVVTELEIRTDGTSIFVIAEPLEFASGI